MVNPAKYVGFVALAAFTLSLGAASAEEKLPIFDTHLHYSGDAGTILTPAQVAALLKEGNVPRALLSSTPNDGTIILNELDPGQFVPFLRPYRNAVRHFGDGSTALQN